MNTIAVICGVVLIITSILLIILVMMQESKTNGMSALTGMESYYDSNNTRTKEKTILKVSKIVVACFFVFSFAATIILALVVK